MEGQAEKFVVFHEFYLDSTTNTLPKNLVEGSETSKWGAK